MVRNALSGLLFEKQQVAEAVAILREGIKLAPEERGLVNNLAYLMVSTPDPEINHPKEAAVMMERICYETNYEDPRYLHTLSLVYASMARLDEAISVATKARDIAAASDKPEFSQLPSFIGLSIERYKAAKQGSAVNAAAPGRCRRGIDPGQRNGTRMRPEGGLLGCHWLCQCCPSEGSGVTRTGKASGTQLENKVSTEQPLGGSSWLT